MMQNTSDAGASTITQLTAINAAKVLTVFCLAICAIVFGISDLRQVIYLCLHVSYCLWWLLEQWFFPNRRQIFNEPIGVGGLSFTLIFVGVFYTLPGYLAFTNPAPISALATAIAIPLYIFGTLINTTADVQKLTAKQYGAGLVQDGVWRFSRNINYFGDLLRYLSFSVVSGSLWAYLVPGTITLLYLQRISQREQTMSGKYSEYAAYQESSSRLIPFLW
nr:DUF1295 domain-containing protein [Chroococcidiopsis sp. [FACHB-1243]]